MRARLPLVISTVTLILAAGVAWGASRLHWVAATAGDGLGLDRTVELTGSSWAPATVPLALVLLATVAAQFAVRGRARRWLAVAPAATGVGLAVVPTTVLLGDPDPDRARTLANLPTRFSVADTTVHALGPVLTLVAAVLALVAAGAIAVAPATTGSMGSRYDAPAARRERARRAASTADLSDETTERSYWDALDAGEDPTEQGDEPTEQGGEAQVQPPGR